MVWICLKDTGGCGKVDVHHRFEVGSGKNIEIRCPSCGQDHANRLNVLDFEEQTKGLNVEEQNHAFMMLTHQLVPPTPAQKRSFFSGR